MIRFVLVLASALPVVGATYTGAASCAPCHAAIHKEWSGARHSKMVQPATVTSVQGDFMRGTVTLRGQKYVLSKRNGAFYVTESYLTGQPREHRIDYTLGNRRIQHYLTTLPDGRILVLPPSWDILRKNWFHNFDIGDPDESGDVEVQLWNKACYSCHVSQEEKGFDPQNVAYRTEWLDFGVNCERCHGPGSEHVQHYSAQVKPAGPARDIVLQTRLDPARDTMICAQCHSFRDIFVPDFKAGDDFYDHFVPILEFDQPVNKDPAYWPDGRTRRFSTDAFGLWQSRCFLKGGATCVRCHVDAHDTSIEKAKQLRPDDPAICGQCHADVVKSANAHTHHAAGSAGSSCVECHMPRSVLSIKAKIRDHTIGVPVPENTTRHGIPNACNECHADRDAAWAAERMTVWWGDASRRKSIRRADAFALARRHEAEAIPGLLAIATDVDESPFARANALGYLGSFKQDPRVFPIFEWALGDAHPLPRVIAALGMPRGPGIVADLTRALRDSVATVRLAAAVSLVGAGVKSLPGDDGRRFEEARSLYFARAALNSDDGAQQVAAGRFFLLTGNPSRAAESFVNGIRIDPGLRRETLEFLNHFVPSDALFLGAQTVLKSLAAP